MTTKTITIDGTRHQIRHILPITQAEIAAYESLGIIYGSNLPITLEAALWSAHLTILARREWGPTGSVYRTRRDSYSRDGSTVTFELTLCPDRKRDNKPGGGRPFVNRWATWDREELAEAAETVRRYIAEVK